MNRTLLYLLLGLAGALSTACDDNTDADAGTDASVMDAAAQDAGGGTDAGPGPGTDAGSDAGTDAAVPPAPTITTTSYVTADQMLLANEINESGEPFAEALGYDLDLLDPAVAGVPDDRAYVLGIENYEYSRYQLGTVVRNSGIGLHMMWAPLVRRAASMEPDTFDGSMTGTPNGVNEDDELMKIIMMFSQLSNETPAGHAWPQYAEFASGDPHLPMTVDAANFSWTDVQTMRWDRSTMDRHLMPSAMGQTLMKQYLWAQDMLSAFHDGDDNGIDATGSNSPDMADSPMFDPDNNIFYGGDARDGFIGMVLTAQAINKIAFLTNALAYDGTALGRVDLASYDPASGIRYFPHSVAVTEEAVAGLPGLPPRMSGLTVSDDSSQLFDQVSLLWGTTNFTNMMNPGDTSDAAHLAYREVFDGSPFPASRSETGTPGPYDLMKGTSRAIFMNLRAMHFDSGASVYVDEANLVSGAATHETGVSTFSSAYLIVALESFVEAFTGTPLHDMAVTAVSDQATYMIAELSDGSGAYFDRTTIGGTHSADRSLLSQAAAVRALYVAHRVTGDAAFSTAADAAYANLIADFHVPAMNLFRTVPGGTMASYNPRNFAVLAGALREAAIEGSTEEASNIYTRFFMNVGDRMQVAEDGATGETGTDSDGDGIPWVPEQPDALPAIFASEGLFTLPE